MDYKEFIKKYQSAKDKDKFLEKHITTKYLPYQRKIAEAKKIIELTMYSEVNGKKVFQQNSPLFYLMFVMRTILCYTDIAWEENENIVEVYNELCEANVFEPLILTIPHKEYDAFNTVLCMVKNDEMENYRSVAGFFDSKVDALGLMLNAFTEVVSTIETEEK